MLKEESDPPDRRLQILTETLPSLKLRQECSRVCIRVQGRGQTGGEMDWRPGAVGLLYAA
jgi:hypothetical protein